GTQNAQFNGYFFIVGVHSASGGNFYSAFVEPNGNNYFPSQPKGNWGNGSYGTRKSPLVPGWAGRRHNGADQGANNEWQGDVPGWYDAGAKYLDDHFPPNAAGQGGVSENRLQTGNSGTYTFGSYDTTGYINVDSSRYIPGSTDLNKVPNLSGGWMVSHVYRAGLQNWVNWFGSAGGNNEPDNILNFVETGGDIRYSNGYYRGQSFGLRTTQNGQKVPLYSTKYNIITRVHHRDANINNVVDMRTRFGLRIDLVDKGNLRTNLNNRITQNYQQADYTSGTWAAYISALAAAGSALGNPTSTQATVDTANTNLTNAVNGLVRVTYTAAVTHKLPAVDGFVYNYKGTNYTAAGGFITWTESQTFNSSYNVSLSANSDFAGYTYTAGGSPANFNYRRSDVSAEFVYEAIKGTLTFVYGTEHEDFIYDFATIDKTKQVTYAQYYGTLPEPEMDGWRFDGWYNTAGVRVREDTTIYDLTNGGNVVLEARWTCYFDGGHGSEADPFLIATPAQLDAIDSAGVMRTTAGKYFKQTADIAWISNYTPVATFSGNYNGQNYTISNPSGSPRLVDSTAAGIFGVVSGGSISNLKFDQTANIRATGTSGDRAAGIIAVLDNSTLDNVHVINFTSTIETQGTAPGGNTGVLVGLATGDSSITNSSVVLNSGVISNPSGGGQNALVGTLGQNVTLANTWVLVRTAPAGFQNANANNIMRVRANGTAAMTFNGTNFVFTATPASGFAAQFRDGSEAVIEDGATYVAPANLDGAEYYAVFVKDLIIEVPSAQSAFGTVTGAGVYQVRQGEVMTGIVAVPATGYRFTSWTQDGGANGTISPNASSAEISYTAGASGGYLRANFAIVNYTVTFDANAGGDSVTGLPGDINRNYNQSLTMPAGPSRTGFTFQKWNTETDGSGTDYFAGTGYTNLSVEHGAVVTLYAQWQATVYTLSFVTNGAATLEDEFVNHGDPFIFPIITQDGFVFEGWYTNIALTTGKLTEGATITVTQSRTYYAKWDQMEYDIVYVAPGATNVPGTQNVKYVLPAPSFNLSSTEPELDGFVFLGWSTDPQAEEPDFLAGELITVNLTDTHKGVVELYAVWEVGISTYTVTWNLNGGRFGGSATNPTSVVENGDEYELPAESSLSHPNGLIFLGWFTASSGGVEIKDGDEVTLDDDVIYYAQWRQPKYTIIFDKNASDATGTMENIVSNRDEVVYLPEHDFVRSGYTFEGWSTDSGAEFPDFYDEDPVYQLSMTDGGEITLFAVWSGRQVRIVYNGNGATSGSMGNVTTFMGQTSTLSVNTYQKDGHSFEGWALTSDGEVAYADGDTTFTPPYYAGSPATVTLYAVWEEVVSQTPPKLIPMANSTTVIDYDKKFIYGLKLVVTESDLRNTFLDVDGDGYFVVQPGTLGTGAKVTLYSNYDPNFSEEYWLVIFGDVTGDGLVTASDVSEIKRFIADNESVPNLDNRSSPFFFAADLYQNGVVNQSVASIVNQIALGARGIDQQTGLLI
ncbi:MAG: InlB B-repeat-containing protein, partial [Oscillospiraceae bacterium]|nr:InlB B-repeat-containing protein [Oscillospiraceae bacterium]